MECFKNSSTLLLQYRFNFFSVILAVILREIRFYYRKSKNPIMGNTDKKNIQLTEKEWQVVLDSLSNTIFNEEITEEARKNAKELFIKINKNV